MKPIVSNLIIFILLTVSSCSSFQSRDIASSPVSEEGLFGPEWTFTIRNDTDLYEMAHVVRLLHSSLMSKIRERCPECEVSNNKINLGNYVLTTETDPGVIEVNTTPVTVSKLFSVMDKVQTILFESAAEVGLFPHDRIGGGHIHLDVESHFKNDPVLIRNFIVDMFNHPELFLGTLGFDPLNAPPLAILSKEQIDTFENILANFDNNEIDIDTFIGNIKNDVYNKSFMSGDDFTGSRDYYLRSLNKFQLVNLNNFPTTIEIRGFGPQKSVKHFFMQIKLLSARIRFLKKNKSKIPFQKKYYGEHIGYTVNKDIHKYTNTIPDEAILDATKSYIVEAGESVDDYNFLFPEKFRLKSSALNSCSDLLKTIIAN